LAETIISGGAAITFWQAVYDQVIREERVLLMNDSFERNLIEFEFSETQLSVMALCMSFPISR
jgi:hypothetical protein